MISLKAQGQSLTASDAQHLTFTEDYPHLHEILNRIRKDQNLGEGGRHDINTIIGWIYGFLKSETDPYSPEGVRKARDSVGLDVIRFTIEAFESYLDLNGAVNNKKPGWDRKQRHYENAIKFLELLSNHPEKLTFKNVEYLQAIVLEYIALKNSIPISIIELDAG